MLSCLLKWMAYQTDTVNYIHYCHISLVVYPQRTECAQWIISSLLQKVKQEYIPVGCVQPALPPYWGDLCDRDPPGQRPPLDRDPPGQRPTGQRQPPR